MTEDTDHDLCDVRAVVASTKVYARRDFKFAPSHLFVHMDILFGITYI